ncbi:WXG100 family type VII secretion target [Amycolatopsis sp. WAC 04197]|uniref:WXG100 family type VII secretion target n=1 Tax=Amycolatopsis sp. WAC 04197 TaxID=2203199 RepID=UPI000F7A6118|nr:hypothetical protein [Amycolatopsis sp. WAC 04197]
MGQLQIEPATWSAGAGIIDTGNYLATTIRQAHERDQAVVAAELGIGVVALTLDTASMVLDPLGKLIAAGLGWLIEHVAFLRAPLDMLAGDPPQIKAMADRLHRHAEDVRLATADLDRATRSATSDWEGETAESFTAVLSGYRARLESVSESIETAGYVVETTMAVIAAVRALVRDIITSVLGDIIATVVIALALAPFTFGASLVIGTTRCVVLAALAVAGTLAKISLLRGFCARAAERLDGLATPAPPMSATTARPAGPSAAGGSALRNHEVPWLKKHEQWLMGHGLAEPRRRARFLEQWIRQHHPETFRVLKTLSDAKSSSNYVGLADKAAITFGRQMTDIHAQAEAAWAEARKQWDAGHPDAAASPGP